MAKKTKIQETVSNEENKETYITTPTPKDTLAEKVIALKNKGFDNNRIAATLLVNRHIVDGIINDPNN